MNKILKAFLLMLKTLIKCIKQTKTIRKRLNKILKQTNIQRNSKKKTI